ncbi:hypothetical protein ABUT84_25555, partial [Escherichia coli]|uniref:hypothetical protein n=1 Tax=Escherichia coli TaxID=562 RepID=UPI00335194CB
AIIVHGNHKPDKQALAELAQFATSNSSNCLVIISDKYDKKKPKQCVFFALRKIWSHHRMSSLSRTATRTTATATRPRFWARTHQT